MQMLIILLDMFVSARPFPMAHHWLGQAYAYGCSYMTVIAICMVGGNDIQAKKAIFFSQSGRGARNAKKNSQRFSRVP